MPFFRNTYNYAKEHNIIFGIIFSDLTAFIAYFLSYGVSFVVLGDIHMLFGAILGVYFSLKYKKSKRSPLIIGIFVGIAGTFFTTLTLTIFQWAYSLKINSYWFFTYLIPAVVIGPIVGAILGLIFKIKQKNNDDSSLDDEFLRSLEDQ